MTGLGLGLFVLGESHCFPRIFRESRSGPAFTLGKALCRKKLLQRRREEVAAGRRGLDLTHLRWGSELIGQER